MGDVARQQESGYPALSPESEALLNVGVGELSRTSGPQGGRGKLGRNEADVDVSRAHPSPLNNGSRRRIDQGSGAKEEERRDAGTARLLSFVATPGLRLTDSCWLCRSL